MQPCCAVGVLLRAAAAGQGHRHTARLPPAFMLLPVLSALAHAVQHADLAENFEGSELSEQFGLATSLFMIKYGNSALLTSFKNCDLCMIALGFLFLCLVGFFPPCNASKEKPQLVSMKTTFSIVRTLRSLLEGWGVFTSSPLFSLSWQCNEQRMEAQSVVREVKAEQGKHSCLLPHA